MIVEVDKGKHLVLGLEWSDCLEVKKKAVIAEQKRSGRKKGVILKNDTGEIAIGAIESGAGHSAAALLAYYQANALCVMQCDHGWWVSSCTQGLPVSENVLDTAEEAQNEAFGLMSVMDDIAIFGDEEFFGEHFPDTEFDAITWEDFFNLSSKEQLNKTKLKTLGTDINIAQLGMIIGMIPVLYYLFAPEPENTPSAEENWQKIHQNEVFAINQLFANTIKNEPFPRVSAYMDTLLMYPYSIAGWIVNDIQCIDTVCKLTWNKRAGAGTYKQFNESLSVFEQQHAIQSINDYSNTGETITHRISISEEQRLFAPNISDLSKKNQFFIDSLAPIQTATRSNLFNWYLDAANASPQLTPAPDNRSLPDIQFNYGVWSIKGSNLLAIKKAAAQLTNNQFSVTELNITLNQFIQPTWSLKGAYAYR